jgi:hypothetical protein
MVIEFSVVAYLVGVPGTPGKEAAIAENTCEAILSPTTFLAVTLNL